MLKDGENGVDGMSDPHYLTFSNDGSHIYVPEEQTTRLAGTREMRARVISHLAGGKGWKMEWMVWLTR